MDIKSTAFYRNKKAVTVDFSAFLIIFVYYFILILQKIE